MINRRCRKCCCMNNNFYNSSNSNCINQNVMETACNNTCSSCEKFNDNCGCGFEDDEIDVFPSNPMLAQSYVPIQYMDETFKPCTGLENGTIFPELVSPYAPCDSMRDIAFIEKTNKIGKGCNSCQ